MNKSEQARTVMLEHRLNCAQSIVSVYCEEFGLERNLGLKTAMGFGSGMARSGNTCGAITGAYMILDYRRELMKIMPVRVSIKLTNSFNSSIRRLRHNMVRYRVKSWLSTTYLFLNNMLKRGINGFSLPSVRTWLETQGRYWNHCWLLIEKHQHNVAVLDLVITPFDVLFTGFRDGGFTT